MCRCAVPQSRSWGVVSRAVAACVVLALAAPAPWARAADPPPRALEIDEYQVVGNTVLPPADIEAAVYDFLGPDRTAADVEKARAALEKLYTDRGYPTVSVEVPRQSAESGVITLHVTERRVGRLRVTGSRYVSLDAVKSGAPSLHEGEVPHVPDVQRDIVSLNQLPARTVTPVLRAGRAPDTVDVDLQVADQLPVHATLELNNRRSADTTPLRLTGSVGYDNLWQRGDSASLFFQVAPQNTADASVFSASYLFHIPGSTLSLLASYLKSDSNVNSIGGTNVIGKGQIAGLRLLIPVVNEAGSVQSLSVGADWKSFGQNITLSGQGSQVPLEYYPVTLSYQGDWFGTGEQTDLTAAAVLGTRGLGSGQAAFDANRYAAQPNFFYFRGSLARQQDLPFGLQAWAKVQGQLTPDPIVPNEQFSVGGLDTVRGYVESEALADTGGVLQMELRSPQLAGLIGDRVNDLRVHAFTDLSATTINKPLPQQRRAYSLNSVGTGVRVRLFDHYSGELQDAVTLTNGPTTHGGNNQVLFRLYGDF